MLMIRHYIRYIKIIFLKVTIAMEWGYTNSKHSELSSTVKPPYERHGILYFKPFLEWCLIRGGVQIKGGAEFFALLVKTFDH